MKNKKKLIIILGVILLLLILIIGVCLILNKDNIKNESTATTATIITTTEEITTTLAEEVTEPTTKVTNENPTTTKVISTTNKTTGSKSTTVKTTTSKSTTTKTTKVTTSKEVVTTKETVDEVGQYVPVGVTSSLKGWTATTLEGNKVSVTYKGHTNIGTLVRDGVEGHYSYKVDFGTGSVNVEQRLFYLRSPEKYLLSLNSEGKVSSAETTMDKIGQYITVSNTLSCTESEAKNIYNPSCAKKYWSWFVGYLNSHPGHTLYDGYVYDTNFRNIGLYVYEGIPKSEEEHQAEEAKNNAYCRECEEGFNYKQFFLN